MSDRIRWWLISQLGKLPGQCWADLVSWQIGWSYRRRGLPWSPNGGCRRDIYNWSCYCGKLRGDG